MDMKMKNKKETKEMKNTVNNTNLNNKEIGNMKVNFEKVKKEISLYLELYKTKGEAYLKEYVEKKDYKGFTEQEGALLASALKSLCKRGSTEFLTALLGVADAFNLFNLYEVFKPVPPVGVKEEDIESALEVYGRQQEARTEEYWLIHTWVLYSNDFIKTIVDAAIKDLEENFGYMCDRDSVIEEFLDAMADDIDCRTIFSANIKVTVLEHISKLVAEFEISDLGFEKEEFEDIVWDRVKDSDSLVDYIYREHEDFIYEATRNILTNGY